MTPSDEIRTLRRRYERLLRFDRVVCGLYCLTAAIPIYFLCSVNHARSFHALGATLILAVGVSGIAVDTKILRRRSASEVPAYLVTAAFLLSRTTIVVWGGTLVGRPILKVVEARQLSAGFLDAILELVFAPPIAYLIFFLVCYRVVYHISVHFLLKIREMETPDDSTGATDESGNVSAVSQPSQGA